MTASTLPQERDPYSMVYDSLWDMLEARTQITSRVRSGNRVKYSGDNRAPDKDKMLTGDLPEIRISVTKTDVHMNHTSNSTSVMKAYEVQVLCGDQRLDKDHLPLEFELLRAFATAHNRLTALKWHNISFVKSVKPITVQDVKFNSVDGNSSVRGWIGLWAVEVTMFFGTLALQGEE